MSKCLVILVTLLMQFCSCLAQTDSAQVRLLNFVKNINAFNYAYPQEKVYLHFDNTGYFIGENMWFKAYVVAGPLHKPTNMSGVLYAELLTSEGRIVQSCKLKIENGQAQGRFQLGHLLHSGYYEVRAYTRMMLNWDESGIFSRVFPIFDKAKTTADYLSPKMTIPLRSQKIPEERLKSPFKVRKMNMLFFPEGGSLISGLRQNVAFRIFSQDGTGLDVKGAIFDKQGTQVSTFSTLRKGIGTFSVTAYEGEPLTARFSIDGKDYDFTLPDPLRTGYSMTVSRPDSTESHVNLLLQRNIISEEPTGLSISNGGNVYIFQHAVFNDDDNYSMNIDMDALRDGVNQIALFNDKGQILCQRMIFKRPKQLPAFTAKFDKTSYKPFDKVAVDFSLTDESGKPQPATFSVTVRDMDTNLPGSHTGNAFTNLLLSSDLKGFIENPEWYFESDDYEHEKALDNLMLTQGWYRYNWQQMSRPEEFKITHFIEDGLIISGKLSSLFRHKDKSGSHISVILYDKEKGLTKKGSTEADSTGHFAFRSEDFTGRWQMYIRTADKDKEPLSRTEMNVHLDRQFTPDSRPYEPLDTWMYINSPSSTDTETPTEGTDTPDRRKLDRYKYENLIPETVITAEKRWMEGKAIKSANIVYDLEEERTREDDTGELYLETLFDYLFRTNKYFSFEINEDGTHTCYYKGRDIQWIIDNKDFSLVDIESINAKDLEAILINDKFGAALSHSNFTGLDSINGKGGDSSKDPMSEEYNPEGENTTESAADLNDQIDSIAKNVLIYLYLDKNAVRDRKGERNTVVQGFTKNVDFYSPDYEDLVLPDEKDFRRTLYWNPSVTTSSDGKAKVVFYNNGQCTDMELEAETVTSGGTVANTTVTNRK